MLSACATGQLCTHLLLDKFVHSACGVKRHRVGAVEVRVCCGACPSADIIVRVRTTEDVREITCGVCIVAAVHHGCDVQYEEDAAETITTLTVLEGSVLQLRDVDSLGFLLGH